MDLTWQLHWIVVFLLFFCYYTSLFTFGTLCLIVACCICKKSQLRCKGVNKLSMEMQLCLQGGIVSLLCACGAIVGMEFFSTMDLTWQSYWIGVCCCYVLLLSFPIYIGTVCPIVVCSCLFCVCVVIVGMVFFNTMDLTWQSCWIVVLLLFFIITLTHLHWYCMSDCCVFMFFCVVIVGVVFMNTMDLNRKISMIFPLVSCYSCVNNPSSS